MSEKKEKNSLGLFLLVMLLAESEPLIIQALIPSISFVIALLLSACVSTLLLIGVFEIHHRKEEKFSIMEVKM